MIRTVALAVLLGLAAVLIVVSFSESYDAMKYWPVPT